MSDWRLRFDRPDLEERVNTLSNKLGISRNILLVRIIESALTEDMDFIHLIKQLEVLEK